MTLFSFGSRLHPRGHPPGSARVATVLWAPVAAVLLSLTWACNQGDEGPAGGPPSSGSRSASSEIELDDVEPAELLDPVPFDSETSGALHGLVRVTGEVPERFPIGARKVSDCCSFEDVEHLSDIVVADEGRLKYAYVRVLTKLPRAEIPPPPTSPALLDQRGCIYTPHVIAMQVGQELHVLSSDPTTHNVNLSAPANNKLHNLAMVEGQDPLVFEFRRSDRVKVRCDIHPWMSAWVHVSDHPWFAVTDDAGAFSIPNVPPGEYVLEVHHEEFGTLHGSVVLEPKVSTGVTFEFVLD